MDSDMQSIVVINSKDAEQYSQVIFEDVAEHYVYDADLVAVYSVSKNDIISDDDYVGLYKVCWSSPKDFIFRVRVHSSANQIIFPASCLPHEDGEFYQFCYLNANEDIRGASTPFQLCSPAEMISEYVAEADDELDLMMVKSRTVALGERLLNASMGQKQLKEQMAILLQQKRIMESELHNHQCLLELEKEKNKNLSRNMELHQEQSESLQGEASEMIALFENLKEKMGILNQEKETILKRLQENDGYISSLQEKIKNLITEKESLTGQLKASESERELMQESMVALQADNTKFDQELTGLKEQLNKTESEREEHQITIDSMKELYQNEKLRLHSANMMLDELREKLDNTADKLMTSEHCKKMLNEEVSTVQSSKVQIHDDLGLARAEVIDLSEQLAQTLLAHQKEKGEWSEEMSALKEAYDQKLLTVQQLEANQSGPMYALRMAQEALKERYQGMTLQCNDLKQEVDGLKQQKMDDEDQINLLNAEVADLKKRLEMSFVKYKNCFVEWQLMKVDLEKIKKVAGQTEKQTVNSVGGQTDKQIVNSVGGQTDKQAVNSVAEQTELQGSDPILQQCSGNNIRNLTIPADDTIDDWSFSFADNTAHQCSVYRQCEQNPLTFEEVSTTNCMGADLAANAHELSQNIARSSSKASHLKQQLKSIKNKRRHLLQKHKEEVEQRQELAPPSTESSNSEEVCPICYDDMSKLSQQEIGTHIDGHYHYTCPVCESTFDTNVMNQIAFSKHIDDHYEANITLD